MKKLIQGIKSLIGGKNLALNGEYNYRVVVTKMGDSEVNPPLPCEGTVTLEKALTEKKDEEAAETTENDKAKEEETSNITSSVQGSNMAGLSEKAPVKFSFLDKFNTIALRILVIDDKIGKKDSKAQTIIEPDQSITIEIKDCDNNECTNCPKPEKNENCKLHVIKKLMNYTNLDDINAPKNQFHYWNQVGIKTYYCPTVIKDFIDDETFHFTTDLRNYPKRINIYSENKDIENGELNIKCNFAPKIEIDNLHVQIVGVRDVRTALLLMSKFKFDMVFCDYLLDYKEGDSGPRDYATQLFEFLSHNYKKEIEKEEKKDHKDENNIKRLKVLDQLRHDVLDNRGPLDKLWIMPITGFNQTFIQDLYRNQIDLIGHKWNISNGADPITTPWQFLYHLNKFIELQLKSCVYTREQLMTFLLYTYEDLYECITKTKNVFCFEEFQQFMGAEYANFMKRYGARKLIERDAAMMGGSNNENKSVFATYISDRFYNNPKYSTEIELNRLMQDFYHQAATMFNDSAGHKRLRESFEQLRLFIAYNQLDGSIDKKERKELKYGLRFLHVVIDSEFDVSKISKWREDNPQNNP